MIVQPGKNDVLHGRGYKIRTSPGNLLYRSLVVAAKAGFDAAPTSLKGIYAHQVINHIFSLDPPGRFLKKIDEDSDVDCWEEVSKEEAVNKVRQALRDAKPSSISPEETMDHFPSGANGIENYQEFAANTNQIKQDIDDPLSLMHKIIIKKQNTFTMPRLSEGSDTDHHKMNSDTTADEDLLSKIERLEEENTTLRIQVHKMKRELRNEREAMKTSERINAVSSLSHRRGGKRADERSLVRSPRGRKRDFYRDLK